MKRYAPTKHATNASCKKSKASPVSTEVSEESRHKGFGKTHARKLLSMALTLAASMAEAAPVGGKIVAGTGNLSQSGTTTTVVQASPVMSLTWHGFDIAPNETVNFLQPSAAAIAVNRISGNSGSQIFGHLNANGQVFLINPNGVLFGQGTQINVGGLVASTLDVQDASLTGDKKTFSGSSEASVVNEGTIKAGYVALLGNHVGNQGLISAELGTVAIGAGSSATLTFSGTKLLDLQVNQNLANSLAENGGIIRTPGGQVIMSAGARDSLVASVVNNTGVIEARTVSNLPGNIILLGGMLAGQTNVAGTLDASAPDGGNGGAIETSASRVHVADTARITSAAAKGKSGKWLIDPVDFTIASSGGDLSGATLSSSLDAGDVSIQSSSGNVNVNDVVSWSRNALTLDAQNNININASMNGTGSANLALLYGQAAAASGNASDVLFHAAVNLPSGSSLSTKLGANGAVTIYTVINALGAAGSMSPSDLQGMQGNLAANYALGSNIDAGPSGAWNSSAGFTPVGSVSTPYTGAFNGLGHTISNLTINLPGTADVGLFGAAGAGSAISNVGLLNSRVTGAAGTGGLVGNNTTGSVSNSYNQGTVKGAAGTGGLVGSNITGNISNSYVIGTVSGDAGTGGLVGSTTSGSVSNSYAVGDVSGAAGAGGLVGSTTSGNVSGSHATGNVTGGAGAGGLVGSSTSGNISNGYALGNVTGAAGTGGLVGSIT